MYSEKQQSLLKNKLHNRKKELEERTAALEIENTQSTGELSSYDNHPADTSSELFEAGRGIAMMNHMDEESRAIEQALTAIEDGTYGICRECKEEIPFERMEIVPQTLYCINHAPRKDADGRRSIEEEILTPPAPDSFESGKRSRFATDHRDSFDEVAQYGTSETPSDFSKDVKDYEELYENKEAGEGFTETYESFAATDITGSAKGIKPSKTRDTYKDELDEEGMESPIGDIPYKEKDSYTK